MSLGKIRCGTCGAWVRRRTNGEPYKHLCKIAPTETVADVPAKGPWFGAQYAGECGTCFNRFEEGDQIRADGEGGWECEAWCGQDDEVEPVRSRWDPRAQDACDVCGITDGAHGGWCLKPLSKVTPTVPEPTPYDVEASLDVLGVAMSDPAPAPNKCMYCGTLHVGAHSGYLCTCGHCSRTHAGNYSYGNCGTLGCTCERFSEDSGRPIGAAPVSDPAPTVDVMDDFSDPTPARGPQGGGVAGAPSAADFDDPSEPEPEVNVSGQPKARYEWRGKVNMGYLVVDPERGDFRRYKNKKPQGLTRATTFNKAASDSKAINDWGKRNVVIGASRRPDIIDRADGLTHETDRDALNGIVAELEEAAGAKVSADIGTALHAFTEQMDAGLKTPMDAPARYRTQLTKYRDALREAGFEPVPGLIERTTMVREFGGVVGTFDRIFYHRPSDSYMVGDLKTGKTMEYAMDETQTQMWLYAHGVNQNGIYDWNDDVWTSWLDRAEGGGTPVREDVGVVIHMPVQGPLAGQVILDKADLVAGARHAELCHAIRSRHKSKVTPWSNDDPVLQAPGIDWNAVDEAAQAPRYGDTTLYGWRVLFNSAETRDEARGLYSRAVAVGVPDVDLKAMAADTLQRLSKS